LTKINLKNAFKPKIYSIKNAIDPSLVGRSNSMGMVDQFSTSNSLNFDGTLVGGSDSFGSDGFNNLQTVKVPFPVLVEKFNVIGKSENTLFNSKTFYGNAKIQIIIYPFDNIVSFVLASGDSGSPEYMDLTKYDEISFVIRNDFDSITFPIYDETDSVQLDIGQIVFRLDKNKYSRIKNIYDSGINIFYITGTSQDVTSVIYTGLFKIFESRDNISALNDDATSGLNSSIIDDPDLNRNQETAVVTRRIITEQTNPNKKSI
jgi:hypothetical protein